MRLRFCQNKDSFDLIDFSSSHVHIFSHRASPLGGLDAVLMVCALYPRIGGGPSQWIDGHHPAKAVRFT
jgi:hypothetical protein